MSLIPEEELKPSNGMNFAPMIDFLFLMLALFATLALTRSALYDASIDLAQVKVNKNSNMIENEIYKINLSIDVNGHYRWVTEFNEYLLKSALQVQDEISKQYQTGLIPKDKKDTLVLLHIDRLAPWDSVASLIFAIKEIGFDVHPIYESEK
jgi:biopolymer transport protein ExbD